MEKFKSAIIFILLIVVAKVLIALPKALSLTNQINNSGTEQTTTLTDEQIQGASKALEIGDYADALSYVKYILANKDNSDFQNSDGWMIKGIALMGLGKSEGVEQALDKAIQYNCGNFIAYYMRAKYKYSKKDFSMALADAKEARRLANLQGSSGISNQINSLIVQIEDGKGLKNVNK